MVHFRSNSSGWNLPKIHRFHDVLFFAGDTLPFNARVEEFGKSVKLIGVKPRIGIAALPAGEAERAADQCARVFGGFWSCAPLPRPRSTLEVLLMPTNQCLHPSRMYDLFADWDGEAVWMENPLFYRVALVVVLTYIFGSSSTWLTGFVATHW